MVFLTPVSITFNSHNELGSLLQRLPVISQTQWTATSQASKRINRFKACCLVTANDGMIIYTTTHTILSINKGIVAIFSFTPSSKNHYQHNLIIIFFILTLQKGLPIKQSCVTQQLFLTPEVIFQGRKKNTERL